MLENAAFRAQGKVKYITVGQGLGTDLSEVMENREITDTKKSWDQVGCAL